jgi:hypothetical protein
MSSPGPLGAVVPLKRIEQSQSADFPLPSLPCTIRKYLLPNKRALLLNYKQFLFEYFVSVLALHMVYPAFLFFCKLPE